MGYHSERGFEPLVFEAQTFIVITDIDVGSLTDEADVAKMKRTEWTHFYQPASIQRVGANSVWLCEKIDLKVTGQTGTEIFCDSNFEFDEFVFNLETKLFSLSSANFQSARGGTSRVAVGKCKIGQPDAS